MKEKKMPNETKTVRVLQGQSIEVGGVWYNQGETVTVPADRDFPAGQVEEVNEAPKAKNSKQEG